MISNKKWPIGQQISEKCQLVWWLRNKSKKKPCWMQKIKTQNKKKGKKPSQKTKEQA